MDNRLNQARTLSEQGDEEGAQKLLLALLKEQPLDQAALLMLAGSYYLSTRYAESEILFGQLITMLPGDGKVSIGLYNALWQQGKVTEAVGEIKRFFQTADRRAEASTFSAYMKILETLSVDEGNVQ